MNAEPASSDSPPDRAQRAERRPVELDGYALLEDGTTTDVTLLDLSYDGCRIRPASDLSPGQRMRLSVSGRGAIDAEVRWSKAGIVGIAFATPEATETRQHQPRKNERITLAAEVSLRRSSHGTYRARVFDASPEGCKVEFVERPREKDRVWVKFDGLDGLEAEVCWVEGFCAGLRFPRPIHSAVFDLLVTRLRG